MKKVWTLCSFLMTLLSFTGHANVPRDYIWENLQCADYYVRDAQYFHDYYSQRLFAAKGYLQRCDGGTEPGGNEAESQCIRFLLDRNYSASTAKETCTGMNHLSFDCLKYMMGKNYSPSTSRASCIDLSSHIELQCIQFLMEKNYSPSTSKSSCEDFTEIEFSCFKDMINRNYSPSTARQTCKQ